MMYFVEKRNISVVMDTEKHTGLPGADEKREIKEIQEKFKQDLRIPRRYREREDFNTKLSCCLTVCIYVDVRICT